MRRRPDALIGRHPFQIYQYPAERRDGTDDGTWWRRVLIRAGWVLGTAATGTDDADDNPYGEAPGDPTNEITVPENVACFWIWLERGTDGDGNAVVTVRSGSDPSTVGDDPWASYPTPDANHIPIGYVNTTNTTDKLATWRQLLNQDVVLVGGGWVWRGEYRSTDSYVQWNVVIVSSGAQTTGTYLAVLPSGLNSPPWEGGSWVKLPTGLNPWTG